MEHQPPTPAFNTSTGMTIIDAAEKYIVERVRQEVAHTVREELLAEFDARVQDKMDEILPEILFRFWEEKDPMRMAGNLTVMLEWVRCREQKKKFVTERVVKEV